ncbi:OB-fold-containig protein [Aquimarina pacifica]|uniref:OB-fold-containig protein n=1 Tax=Aquimarina pacifica TaxID=1296415 RepID=UPI0004B86D62|nr:OB-fold-containig protein [Aquimarina pacifica]
MKELIDIAFSPVNAFFTIMCLILILYWILTILTGFDLDFFDVDFDASADFDLDIDADADLENYNPDVDLPQKSVNAEVQSESIGIQFLRYFSFDELPLMFMLSIIFFSMWFISINVTHSFGWQAHWLGFILLIPNLIISLFIAKIVTKPLAKLYRMINHKGEEEIDFLGRRCIVKSPVSGEKLGQIEVVINGDPIRVQAKGFKGVTIRSGEEALIVNESKDKKYYLIEKFQS